LALAQPPAQGQMGIRPAVTLLSALKALLDSLDEAGPNINRPAGGLPDGSGLQF
jgi:hypothetical protein